MDADAVETVTNQLANIGRSSVESPIAIDHAVENFYGARLLFVRVPEALVKPVHIRGKTIEDSFIRSGGTTRAASKADVGTMLLHSKTPKWEELRTSLLLTDDEICAKLDVNPIFKMLGRTPPTSRTDLLDWMEGEHFVDREPSGGGYITNLGAISAARMIYDFPELSRKAVRVIIYDGLNKSRTKSEREGSFGYALSFQGLLNYVRQMLPQSEIIKDALRTTRRVYPSVALRELIANALIHQDFSISGAGPMVEIFDDRIEISNPGTILPSKRLDRLIGTQPESRNELLARAFRRYKICEERGSGLVKAGLEVELYGLPPMEFKTGASFFKVTLFSPRTYAQMSPRERLQACYQHAVLKHASESTMTNKSLRERLKMPEKQRSMVSVLIQDALGNR